MSTVAAANPGGRPSTRSRAGAAATSVTLPPPRGRGGRGGRSGAGDRGAGGRGRDAGRARASTSPEQATGNEDLRKMIRDKVHAAFELFVAAQQTVEEDNSSADQPAITGDAGSQLTSG